jgi:hypothetical protein
MTIGRTGDSGTGPDRLIGLLNFNTDLVRRGLEEIAASGHTFDRVGRGTDMSAMSEAMVATGLFSGLTSHELYLALHLYYDLSGPAANGKGLIADKAKLDTFRAGVLTPEQVRNMQDPEWLIKQILPLGAAIVVVGKWDTGKTFLAMDFACSAATGTWWHGHAVKSGPVLYVYAEGATGLKKRMLAWETERRVVLTEFPVQWYPRSINLLDPSWGKALAAYAEEIGAVLVVIDTANRVIPGGNENNPEDMGKLVAAVDMTRTQDRSVLVVHHTPRDGSHPRGHSSFEAAMDTNILVSKEGRVVTIECQRQKDAETFPTMRLVLKVVGCPPLDSCCLVSHGAGETIEEENESVATLLSHVWDSFSETPPAPASDLREAAGLPKATFYRALNTLVARGLLVKEGSDARPRYRITDAMRDLKVSHVSQGVPPESQ